MGTARARSPEMMLPLPGPSPPRTCDCRLDCLFLMTGTMFSSMERSHKRRRSDSSSEEGERQHRRRQQPQQHTHTHIHVHVHQPQQRHPDRSKRRNAHRGCGWRVRLRGRKPQGLTFGISSNAKYGVSQYAWASGAEWLISRIQAQTTAVRPPLPPQEDEDAQLPAYAPCQEFVDQVCADFAWQVPECAVFSASADTCRCSIPLLTRFRLLTSSGSTRNGSCSEATDTVNDRDRDLKIRQDAPSLRPMHTLNPARDEQDSTAKTESPATLPAEPYARRERPPRYNAERRSVMASAARLLWTSRVSPPSLAAVPETHRNASIHCHCYPRDSLREPFSLPNCLAYLVPFRPLLPNQPNQNPAPMQPAHKLAQLVQPDQWAALHVRAHTRAHTHPHWKRDQILRCGDMHPNPGPTSPALINVTALRAHHHEVLDLQEDIVALTETRLT